MKLVLLAISILLSFNIYAAKDEKFFEGSAKFLAQDEDTVEKVKKQLLHLAFRDVITKQLQDLGLDVSLFWQRFDEEFEEKYLEEVGRLEEKNKERLESDADYKKQFMESLRDVRMNMIVNFQSLPQAIQSYQISQISRSPRNANMRYMNIEAKVNQKVLNRIYYRLVRGKSNDNYTRLILDIDYHLENGNFTDLGVNNERDFTSVVNQHWGDWFKKNKPRVVEKVEVAESRLKRFLTEYDNIPKEELSNRLPSELRNSLLLKIELSIEKVRHIPEFKEYAFKIKGGLYLLELDTGRVVHHQEIDLMEKEYTSLDYEQLSTALANAIYRQPMGDFSKVNNTIEKLGRVKNTQTVVLYDYKKIDEALGLIEKIKTNGIRFNLDASLQKVEHNRSTYIVYLDGNKKQLTDLIKFVMNRDADPEKKHKYDIVDSNGFIGVKFY
jgi:hypothetical protein